jgi:hypothetical protein
MGLVSAIISLTNAMNLVFANRSNANTIVSFVQQQQPSNNMSKFKILLIHIQDLELLHKNAYQFFNNKLKALLIYLQVQ